MEKVQDEIRNNSKKISQNFTNGATIVLQKTNKNDCTSTVNFVYENIKIPSPKSKTANVETLTELKMTYIICNGIHCSANENYENSR